MIIASTHTNFVNNLPVLTGIKKTEQDLSKTFGRFRYAVYSPGVDEIHDANDMRDLMQAVVSCQLPPTYKKLIIFCTGHGGQGSIYLPNEHIEECIFFNTLNDLQLSQPSLTKVLIIDTCRTDTTGRITPSFDFQNSVVIYSTIPGEQAFAHRNSGGVMTTELLRQLNKCSVWPFSNSLSNIMTKVTIQMRKITGVQDPVMYQSGSDDVNLLKEYYTHCKLNKD